MSVQAAYLGIVLLWATTPLAISWSGEGSGFLFGVTARLTLAAVTALIVQQLFRFRLPWSDAARNSYLAAGVGCYVSMSASYWAAQLMPSGWLSVIFGFTSIFTGLFAAKLLGERAFTPAKLLGTALGIIGLVVVFGSAIEMGSETVWGIVVLLLGVAAFSLSTVLVKRFAGVGGKAVSGMAITTGGTWVAALLFLLTWFITGQTWPDEIGERAIYSTVYLGVISSVFGSFVYFYVLARIEATQVALIPLITPVLALLLGNLLNGESLSIDVWIGTALILSGFSCYQFGGRVWRYRLRFSSGRAS
ncbi:MULTISPECIES: DMT family transporter [Corallincola]|uniref:DMT family transporter n=2 Tax=Corallincola TaxID=1775176 RepID=A0ABY1WM41_9GAMM|nr:MULTISPECIES: DMT family transporter [Corallincola]TAA42669.1 DMT family transporter [Corallincola spongiicola]TCI01680.1 DMT family transporter [Corallincola luteus]